MGCWRNRRLIRRHFGRGLAASELARLRQHTRDCASCRTLYDRLTALEEGLAGNALPQQPVAGTHRDRLLSEIEQRGGVAQVATERWRRPLRWALPIAAVAIVVVAVVVVTRPTGRAAIVRWDDQEFRVKGFDETPLAAQRLGVRLFCIAPTVDPTSAKKYKLAELSTADFDPAGGQCPVSGVLYVTASNLGEQQPYLFVFGLTADLDLRWYYPKPDLPQAAPIEAGALDAPLGHGIMLQVNHQPGAHRVIAVFTDQPLTVAEVERWRDSLRARGVTGEPIGNQTFPGTLVVQTFGVEIGSRP